MAVELLDRKKPPSSNPADGPRSRQGTTATAHRPSQVLAYGLLGSTVLFALGYASYLFHTYQIMILTPFAVGLFFFKMAVELSASFFAFTFVYSAIAYLLIRETPPPSTELTSYPPVGIVYLCCHDLDRKALASLAGLTYPGALYLIVHDDADTPQAQAEVNAVVEALRPDGGREVLLLRRSRRDGGKAGALNYVLKHTGHLYDYFLLCDNDTMALDPQPLEQALPYFTDDQVAVVQGRSVPVIRPDVSAVNRVLSRSIDAFHLFLSICARFGWLPFIGHNALLRTRSVLEAGGFTPGYFSDDLDLTIRLNLRGLTVRYAPDIRLGETHPPSYTAFRKRTYKWAYGCIQTLRAHAWAVLTSPRLSLAEKVSFFQFAGFYVGQTLLLPYLALTFGVLPFFLQGAQVNPLPGIIVGSLIVGVIFLPILAYFVKERQWATGLKTALLCGLVYGATDFCCARGVWDCLWKRQRPWTPTNQRSQERSQRALLGEALFGLLLLAIPLVTLPAFLYIPCLYLFAGKFLLGPALVLFYDDHTRARRPIPPQLVRTFGLVLSAGLGMGVTLAVRQHWVGPFHLQDSRTMPGILVALLGLLAFGTWLWGRWWTQPPSPDPDT